MDNSYDISALGTSIRIVAHPVVSDGTDIEVDLNDFPSSGNPFAIEDAEAGTLEMDVNGESYRRAVLKPITASISMIPNSEDDKKLNNLCMGNFGNSYYRFDFSVHYLIGGEKRQEDYVNGILRSVQKGFTYIGEGRVETRKYVFQFPPPGFE